MAVRIPVVTYNPNGERNCVLVVWSGLLNGDTGEPFRAGDYADRSVQIGGTLGVGGSCTFEGSLDETNFIATTDPQGIAINKVVAAIEVVEEGPRSVRPNVTAGDGTTNFTVTMWARRNR
jgi:hypothetical protein